MPKIRDLAINTIPANVAGDCKGTPLTVPPPPEPTPPQCKPSPTPRSQSVGGVPQDAVIRMKQQLQQRVRRHAHS